MTSLVLSDNALVKSLPEELWRLTNMEDLHLGDNFLTGSISSNVGLLTQLWRMDIELNSFDGTFPDSIGQLTSLKHLGLDQNMLSGSLPTGVWALPLLEYLTIGQNVSGTFDTAAASTTATNFQNKLSFLNMTDSGMTGTLPDSLCSIEHLYFHCSEKLCGCTCPCT